MSEEILINVTPRETRVAIVENGVLQEVNIERSARLGIVGNIFKATVCRVMPGMDAAFVDIGLEKSAFIHASDVIKRTPNNESGEHESITELLHEGQQILVQVVKDQLGTKGARLTTSITIPSKYIVLLPYSTEVRMSAKIRDEDERNRLNNIMEPLLAEQDARCGCILRTAAECVGEEELKRDLFFLLKLWAAIAERIRELPSVAEVYADLPIAVRTLRDLNTAEVEKIRIDSREAVSNAKKFATKLVPELLSRIEHYQGQRPIFDLYGIEDEIQKALQRKVGLKSGGYLIFDQTEAMTTVDVNTGAFIGHRNLEETIFKTNMEAAQAIALQLRLRSLGGIIIIDFIDMEDDEHKRQVMRALEKSLEGDRAKTHVTAVSDLGLVEMTRKRTRESLEHMLCDTCPTCEGRGLIKSAETVCYELFREIMREARQYETNELLVLASNEVVDLLLDEESESLAELEQFIGKTIKFRVEALYTQEQFDVVLL